MKGLEVTLPCSYLLLLLLGTEMISSGLKKKTILIYMLVLGVNSPIGVLIGNLKQSISVFSGKTQIPSAGYRPDRTVLRKTRRRSGIWVSPPIPKTYTILGGVASLQFILSLTGWLVDMSLHRDPIVCINRSYCPPARLRIRSDPVFLHGSGSGFQILWIRIWFSNFSGSGSGFSPEQKKIAERSLKVIYQTKT